MYNATYLTLPVIFVYDKDLKDVHAVGTNQHDRLYLDEDGHIQYANLQNGEGTKFGTYKFVFDKKYHDAKNLPFTKEEIEEIGLTFYDAYFDMVDLEKYASDTYIQMLKESEERNKRLLIKLLELREKDDG